MARRKAGATALRQWRARLGITQAAAAELLGVPLVTFKRWERDGAPFARLVEMACAAIEAERATTSAAP